MKLECFKAGKGDSFLLSWGENLENSMLIDGGIEGTYRFIKQKITEGVRFKSIIVTHVDYDHIGGIYKLLQDEDVVLDDNLIFYLNTPSLLNAPEVSNLVGISHGVKFEQLLAKRNFIATSLIKENNTDAILSSFGLEIQLLSPKKEVVIKLLEKWTADEIYKKYQLENSSLNGMVKAETADLRLMKEILENPPKPHHWEEDLLNSSSIAFIARFQGSSILFLSDSNPTLISDELQSLGFTKENKLVVDLVKVSHHGSKHNTTQNLLERISCNRYFISTDSSAPYNHPNRETLILINEYGRQSSKIPIIIYTNYPLDLSNLVTVEEQKAQLFIFEYVTELLFPLHDD